MRPGDLIGFALTALNRQRRRTVLSLLGVIIGVAAVVVLTALGEGARRYVVGQFRALGSNQLVVVPGRSETTGAFPGATGAPNDLTLQDAKALLREVPGVRLVAPIVVGNETTANRSRRRSAVVLGSTHELLEIRELGVARGQFLPAGDPERGSPLAVLGDSIARELFPGESPLGRVVRIGDWRMRVIGVLEPRGRQLGLDLDEIVIVPVAPAMRLFNRSSLFRIVVQVNARTGLETARRTIVEVLTERHDEEDFTCITQESVVQSLSNILRALTAGLGGIAAISLAVAGVVVMNLMLVSVAERSREVGLLKALGASHAQILRLFLVEGLLTVTAGATLGLILGWVLVRVLVVLRPDLPASPPLWAIAAVFVTAVGAGALFSALPARRASRLDPVAALSGR